MLFAARIAMLSPPVAFLAIPKSKLDSSRNIATDKSGAAEKDQEESEAFRCFRRQLQHISFGKILEPLKPGMRKPEVRLCPDKHYRRSIYGLGPLIVDYPDQVCHTCIVQGWCPK